MFYLYILYSPQFSKNYTGTAVDVMNRLKVHNDGKVKSTRPWRPWIIIYTEEYSTLSEARKREWFLKYTPQGGKEKRKILEKAGISLGVRPGSRSKT